MFEEILEGYSFVFELLWAVKTLQHVPYVPLIGSILLRPGILLLVSVVCVKGVLFHSAVSP